MKRIKQRNIQCIITIFLFVRCLSFQGQQRISSAMPGTKNNRKHPSTRLPSSSPSEEAENSKNELPPFAIAVAGSLATVFSEASMLPLDCIKTVQQSSEGVGLNMIHVGKKIWSDNGIGGFYSGLMANLPECGGSGAVKFMTYEALKNWVNQNIHDQYISCALFICAAFAFIASSIISVPGELLKQRLQMGHISSLSEGIPTIWNNEGIRGFFQGISGVYIRDIPYTMLELGLYDLLKTIYLDWKNMKNKRKGNSGRIKEISQGGEIIAAAITGAITGYITAPLDNVKTKLMLDRNRYNGFIDCVRTCIATNGMQSLFQGAIARVLWLVPATIIYLQSYEMMKRLFEKWLCQSYQIHREKE